MPKFKSAKDYALYLLKFRPRSRRELKKRLLQKGFGEAEIDELLRDFEEAGLLDDLEFARTLVRTRVGELKSRRSIEYELRRYGIENEDARRVIDEFYDVEQVREDALRKIDKLLEKWRNVDRKKKREKIIAYFLRRGHDYSFIRELLEETGL